MAQEISRLPAAPDLDKALTAQRISVRSLAVAGDYLPGFVGSISIAKHVRNGIKKITIVVSSLGGDPSAAFAAYNYLRSVQAEITTFNGGTVDSAAMFIFCAGKFHYSLPGPSRFLMHATALNPMTVSVPIEGRWIEAQLAQLKNMDHMAMQIIAANSKKKESEIEAAIQAQTILSPEEAKSWGLIQDIKPSYMEPGAIIVGVNVPPEKEQNPPAPYSSGSPETVKN